MRLFRRDPRRLPGSLTDETPATAGNWGRDDNTGIKPAIPEGAVIVELDNSTARYELPEDVEPVGYVIDDTVLSPAEFNEVRARAVAAIQAAYRGEPVAAADRRQLEDRYLAVCQENREIRNDRDRLEHVVDGLRERIRGLELTVTALTGQAASMQAYEHGGDLVAPWPAQEQP